MASNWASMDLSSLLPSEVTQAASTITGLVQEFIDLYKQGIEVAKLYEARLSGGSTDVLGTAVQALVDLLEGFLQAGKVHALFVPIPKQFPTDVGAVIPPSLDDIAFNLGFDLQQAGLAFSSNAQQSYGALVSGTGGNRSFFRTFVESLGDALDPNRPQYFDAGDAVTMTVMLLGAPSFAALVDVAAAFNRAFRPQGNRDLTARTVPVPQNLRATVIGLPKATAIGVQLAWDPPQEAYNSPYFPSVDIRVVKYAVIRSTDPGIAQGASSVLDFFSTRNLTQGMTSDDEAQVSKVIAVGSGTNAAFVDDDPSLDADHVYFYTVAWQVEVSEQGTLTTLAFDRVSNIVKTRVRSTSPTALAGTPPDWVAYGSMIDLIPDLAVQVRTILAQVKTLAGRQSGGASGALTKTLSLVQANIDEFANRIDQLNAQAKRLNAIFGAPLPGLFVTQITGVGGNTFLAGELAARLDDRADPSRPPYDANEYVMGVCLVGGGPRLPDIQPIVDFLAALFQPAQEKSPLYKALQSLDALVAVQESFVFGQDLQPLPKNADGTVTLPDGSTVPASSIDPATGLPFPPSRPAIADDGSAVATLDPKNPNAGNTNQKTAKDLC